MNKKVDGLVGVILLLILVFIRQGSEILITVKFQGVVTLKFLQLLSDPRCWILWKAMYPSLSWRAERRAEVHERSRINQ